MRIAGIVAAAGEGPAARAGRPAPRSVAFLEVGRAGDRAVSAGHRAGERSVQERREAASSSSSSGTGYGSSGGSFSGTGSSGRF